MRELSLFTGAGGGLLGTKLLGWTHVGYVEWNEYCQRVIAARIEDGYLDRAPIFTDVREFVQSGAAKQYRGIADVVTAGFPCQPYSAAGRQRGSDDPKDMWPATREVIREVRPSFALLENVPRLISLGYLGRVLGDLAEMGFDARWGCLSAAEQGAPHVRERLWILAYTDSAQREGRGVPSGIQAQHSNLGISGWWETEPGMDRVAYGLADQLERLKAVGNGQCPIVAAKAWEILSDENYPAVAAVD